MKFLRTKGTKMIFGESSERKKLEQQRRSEGRLPPGQSLTLKWPVLHYGDVPRVDLRTWDFRIDGLVEKPVRLTWEEFNKPAANRNSVRHPLRDALEPLRQSLRGRAVHRSDEARRRRSPKRASPSCAANTDSPPIFRSKT